MTLNADIVRLNIVQTGGVNDVGSRWTADMVAPRPVALFTANVPLRDRFRLDVVIDGMTAVAERSRWTRRVRLRVELGPPIRAVGDVVSPPYSMSHVPLS